MPPRLRRFVAAIGVLRFPDLLTRMHAATKPQVLGLILISTGLALELRDARVAALLALVVVAQMVTAPVAGHMVGRASYRAGQVDRVRDPEILGLDGTPDAGDEMTVVADEKKAREVKAAPSDRAEYDKHLRRIVGALARRGFNQGMALRIAREVLNGRIAECEE